MLSMRTIYALRAIHCLAQRPDGWVLVADIAKEQSIPKSYLETILLALQRARIVVSKRGLHGGYQLHTSPKALLIADIMEALEGPLLPFPCLAPAGQACAQCSSRENCVAHGVLRRMNTAVESALSGLTLEELIAVVSREPESAQLFELRPAQGF
jgi:Rrf2 family protein